MENKLKFLVNPDDELVTKTSNKLYSYNFYLIFVRFMIFEYSRFDYC